MSVVDEALLGRITEAALRVLNRHIDPGMGGPPEPVWETYRPEGVAALIAWQVASEFERVPTLAISKTDEWIEGVPFSIHREPGDPFCGDESICAQHEPVFRLAAVDGMGSVA